MNITEYLAYVNNTQAQGWLQRGDADKRGVFVSFVYMDMVNHNPYDAMILAQIIYWHDIDNETKKPRITHLFGGHLWIVKTYKNWRDELHFKSERTVKECMTRLTDAGIIYREQHKSPFHDGQVVSFIRLNWDNFGKSLSQSLGWTDNVYPGGTLTDDPERTPDVPPEKTSDVPPIYTESTTETTPKTKEKKKKTTAPKASAVDSKYSNAQKCELIAAWWKTLPVKPSNIKERTIYQIKAYKNYAENMLDSGITAFQIECYVKAQSTSKAFYHDKPVPFVKVAQNCGAWCAANNIPAKPIVYHTLPPLEPDPVPVEVVEMPDDPAERAAVGNALLSKIGA